MSPDYIKKIIKIRGEVGKKWVDNLPSLIQKYERLWNINVSEPFILSYNYVAPAKTKKGEDVVLKICIPSSEPYYEIPALEFFNGQGSIRLLKENKEENAFLLERALPGEKLADNLQKENAIDTVCTVIQKLHKTPSAEVASFFPTLSEWAKDFGVYRGMFSLDTGPIPKTLFEKAEEIFTQFPKEDREKVLLHGDLHAENILSSQRGYLAIDPKGIIGEREFDLGIFFRRPYQDLPKGSDYKTIVARNITYCAEKLSLDKTRIRDWAFATSINGLVWFLEDENMLRKEYLENAELLDSIFV